MPGKTQSRRKQEGIRAWLGIALDLLRWEFDTLYRATAFLDETIKAESERRESEIKDDASFDAWKEVDAEFPPVMFQAFIVAIHGAFEIVLDTLCHNIEDMDKPPAPAIVWKPEELKTDEDRAREQLAQQRLAAFDHGPRVRSLWGPGGSLAVLKTRLARDPFQCPEIVELSAWTEVRDAVAHRGGLLDDVKAKLPRPSPKVTEVCGRIGIQDSVGWPPKVEADRALCDRMIKGLLVFFLWIAEDETVSGA